MKTRYKIIIIGIILFSVNNTSFASLTPEDEITADQAKLLLERYAELERQEQLNSALSVLIPVIIGLVVVGIVIWKIKGKKKIKQLF